MATVTQLAQGSAYSSTSLSLTNVSVIPGDLLVMFTSSTSNVTSVSNLNGIIMGSFLGLFPISTFAVHNMFGIQTATVTGQTITVNQSPSGNMAAILYRVRPDSGNNLTVTQRQSANYTNVGVDFTTPAINVQQGAIVIGGAGARENTSFLDPDTAGGAWSSLFYEDETLGTDMAVFGQYKIPSVNVSNLTYNGTLGIPAYRAGFVLEILETRSPYWGIVVE